MRILKILDTDIIQNWHVLKGDNTLQRAISKAKLKSILDYQKDQLDTAFSFCKNFRLAVDVGANYGLMSYNMAKKFNKVCAFEIVPEVNECLKINLNKHNLKKVTVYDCGLGNKKQEVAINFNPQSTFSTHVNLEGNDTNAKVETLDSFAFEDVDFIKIDAEGFESFIIQGGIETIKKYTPVILYERKGHDLRYGFEKNSVLNILKQFGYTELKYIGSKNALIGIK